MLSRLSSLALHQPCKFSLRDPWHISRRYVQIDPLTTYKDSLNLGIIKMLNTCLRAERALPKDDRNTYKLAAFINAIKVVGEHEEQLTSGEHASRLPGIGPRISERIQMFLEGDDSFVPPVPLRTPRWVNPERKLGRPPNPNPTATPKPLKDPVKPALTEKDIVINSFMKIPGIGAIVANKVYDAGCHHIEALQLPRFSKFLSKSARTYVRFHVVMRNRVACEQAETAAAFVRTHVNPEFQVHLVSDHRRGAAEAPTIELLVFHPSFSTLPKPVLPPPLDAVSEDDAPQPSTRQRLKPPRPLDDVLEGRILTPLREQSFLVADAMNKSAKWQGIVRIPGRTDGDTWEHVDQRLMAVEARRGDFVRMTINLLPWPSRASGLLAHIGDGRFVHDVRTAARRRGMHLDEYGLWCWAADAKAWQAVELETEAELMRELGMEYVEPVKRNFQFLLKK